LDLNIGTASGSWDNSPHKKAEPLKNEKNEIALVVHACDRYRMLFKGFEYFFKKNWPAVKGINFYFLTEDIDYHSDLFANIKTGQAEWSDRLRAGLQQLSEPLVIYMQEDMWFKKPVDEKILKEILDFVMAENPLLLKLHSSEVYQTHPTGKIFGGLLLSRLSNQASKYLMSHQVSIWNRKFLVSQLLRNEHPWRNERKATKRLKKLDLPLYQIDLLAENGKPAVNKNISNAFRSEYQTVSVNGTLNDNALPFIEELVASDDGELSAYGNQLKHNFSHRLTHDGLPRPRRVGFIKKIFHFSR
jgi:hypothetical protein